MIQIIHWINIHLTHIVNRMKLRMNKIIILTLNNKII